VLRGSVVAVCPVVVLFWFYLDEDIKKRSRLAALIVGVYMS